MAAIEDVWAAGAAYEPYVGRWSRRVAREFVRWLDVVCGTGALAEVILDLAAPGEVVGADPSTGFVARARAHVTDRRARFDEGNALALPYEAGAFDATVSGLVLDFVPDPPRAVAEMARVTRPGGTVAAYVWDYAGQMQLMRQFWDAAEELDPPARPLDEGRRFAAVCAPDALAALYQGAGLRKVETQAVDVPTRFHDIDDYWSPFLAGQAPAPGCAMSLSEERRAALRERLRARLPIAPDGSIPLIARAWAVRGKR